MNAACAGSGLAHIGRQRPIPPPAVLRSANRNPVLASPETPRRLKRRRVLATAGRGRGERPSGSSCRRKEGSVRRPCSRFGSGDGSPARRDRRGRHGSSPLAPPTIRRRAEPHGASTIQTLELPRHVRHRRRQFRRSSPMPPSTRISIAGPSVGAPHTTQLQESRTARRSDARQWARRVLMKWFVMVRR